jgi:phenylacetate-CoA ligase
VTPDDVQSLADLTRLPFTSKLDFRDNYPFGLTAVPPERIARIAPQRTPSDLNSVFGVHT